MDNLIDISGLNKAELLAALYNNSRPMGMGFLQAIVGDMTKEDAEKYVTSGDDSARMFPTIPKKSLDFDYLCGRPLKSDISGDEFDPWGYDRDNGGDGAAAKIIAKLRTKQ